MTRRVQQQKAPFSLLDLWARPISFLPILGRIPGSDAVAALWLSAALEWQRQAGEGQGWTRPAVEWYDATLLSRREQDRARAFWKSLGIIATERIGGVRSPGNALAYTLDVQALDSMMRKHIESTMKPVPKRAKRTVRKCAKRTVPEVYETGVCSDSFVVLLTEETKNKSVRGSGGNDVSDTSRNDTEQPADKSARAPSFENLNSGEQPGKTPTLEQWTEFAKATWPVWDLDDIERAHLSAVASGWRKGRGAKISDWRAHAGVCWKVWSSSKRGVEAIAAAKISERDRRRREAATVASQTARQSENDPEAKRRADENRRALLEGLGIRKAAA